MEKYDIKEINSKLPDARTLYEILVDNKGYYLPSLSSKACTVPYLLKIVKDPLIFKVKRADIKRPALIKQKKTVEELMEIVEGLIKPKNLKLGFDDDAKPDKEWITNILYFLNENHPCFKFEEDRLEREFPKGYLKNFIRFFSVN